MADDHDSSSNTSCSPAELRYAIRSARAVVEALIARDGMPPKKRPSAPAVIAIS
ncbi:hypothetical protein [Microvirga tunisiensis]|uniref:hypothetical protein n=1 Tax=Microvirga tunisiensis TaxID=2108360 RepID=UPI00129CB706|nr:hypothetical protein [Microvirga tunisiensis]